MKQQKIRMAAAAAAAIVLCASLAGAACAAQAPGCSARSAILVDAQTGRVLYEKNADERSLIASTTKIMTGLLVCEEENLDREVTVPAEAVGVEGSSMYLKVKERVTLRDLLYGMMLHSGNDAAVALAIVTHGSVEAFAARMNERAQALGLHDTHFMNPNGLDEENHYSTARDLARLACAAMENEQFRSVVSGKSAMAAGRSLTNHNKLLWRVEGADGIKTGYTKKAGRILVGSACRDGRRLICVTIRDADDWRDQQALLEYGFSAFRRETVLSEGEIVGSVPVIGSKTQRVSLLAGQTVTCCLAEGQTVQTVLHAPQFVYAPVLPGQAGWIAVLVDGVCVRTIPALIAQTAEEDRPARGFWKQIFGG